MKFNFFLFLFLIEFQLSLAVRYVMYLDPWNPLLSIEMLHFSPTPSKNYQFVMARSVPDEYSVGATMYDQYLHDSINVKWRDGTNTIAIREQYGPRFFLNPTNKNDSTLSLINYRIDLQEMEKNIGDAVDTSKFRPGLYMMILGVSVFGFLDGMYGGPHELHIRSVNVGKVDQFGLFSTLTPALNMSARGDTWAFQINDFYELADAQFVLYRNENPSISLNFSRVAFGVGMFLFIYNECGVDAISIEKELKIATQAVNASLMFLGEQVIRNSNFQNFSVLIEFVQPKILGQTHGFSLEHLNSVSMNLLCNETLPSNSSEEIVMFSMYNIAHHFMHCFIPKRSFFTGFRPFPFELAPIVDSIWFAEGWAQYLALNAISPLSTKPKKYHECMMNERFKLVLNESPNLIKQMSLTYLSQIASTQYSLDFRIGGASFSRGALFAQDVDLYLEMKSENQFSLIDCIQSTILWSLKNSTTNILTNQILIDICSNTTNGIDISPIFQKWMGPQPPIQYEENNYHEFQCIA